MCCQQVGKRKMLAFRIILNTKNLLAVFQGLLIFLPWNHGFSNESWEKLEEDIHRGLFCISKKISKSEVSCYWGWLVSGASSESFVLLGNLSGNKDMGGRHTVGTCQRVWKHTSLPLRHFNTTWEDQTGAQCSSFRDNLQARHFTRQRAILYLLEPEESCKNLANDSPGTVSCGQQLAHTWTRLYVRWGGEDEAQDSFSTGSQASR